MFKIRIILCVFAAAALFSHKQQLYPESLLQVGFFFFGSGGGGLLCFFAGLVLGFCLFLEG